MPIRTTCPSCRTVYSLADQLAGKMVRCKKCGEAIAVRAAKRNADAGGSTAREKIQTRPQAPKRSSPLDEDEPARPRRRRRDEESDFSRPIRRNNRGLVIGLIACGVGLMLILGGGVALAILLLSGPSANRSSEFFADADDGWPTAGPRIIPPDSALLHISGVLDENTREAITEKLEELAMTDHFSQTSTHRGDRMTIFVLPIQDVQAFSQKLDFGTVDSVNGRTITMTARKVEGPPPNADAVTKALHQLKSRSSHKRQEAAQKLKDTLPDERRPQVVKALEPLLNDSDFFTRKFAVEALGVWGNKDAVPILLKAMKDKETRGDAMKALGRLKDERAAEPIAERLEEFFDRHDAEEALKQMGPVAEKAVLARLNHHDWQVRMTVCNILGVIGTKQSIPPLEKVVAAGEDPFSGQNHIVARKAEQAIKAIKARQ